MSDSAMDAMTTMVENHFRHLPVVDESGGVVGLLDIAKCLNDAISKLEKSQSTGSNAAQEALQQAFESQGAQGAQVAALQALLGPLMSQAFGNQSAPTLRSLLAGKPSTVVEPTTSLLEAGSKMAESRKAALVVEDGRLVGIFGFKDMMNRAIAKELPLEDTEISVVMTPNPESVSPDMTVLDALQTMHDNKFLTLPVCEDNGTVIGLVNVMDLIYGCGGAEGWRSIFGSTLELDDLSETASQWSEKSHAAVSTKKTGGSDKKNIQKSVAKLRPKKAMVSSSEDTIQEVVQKLANHRVDSAVLVDKLGYVAGIITDTDITRRVIAKKVDPTSTLISEVMTANPKAVQSNDSATEALVMMISHKFRHVPVMDNEDVVGVLDIAKCLNDAISKLERSAASKSPSLAQDLMKQALKANSATDLAALQSLLGPLLSQTFGHSGIPTLREVLKDKNCSIVAPDSTVYNAAAIMAEDRKAALVVQENELIGIVSFRDLMNRVVAKNLDPSSTEVVSIMTPDPECITPDMNALEALQMMHDNKFLTLPVCEDEGDVVGLVDVMDVIHACGDAEHWRSLFEAAMDVDDVSEIQSAATPGLQKGTREIKIAKDAPMVGLYPGVPGNIPSTLEFEPGANDDFDDPTLNDTLRLDGGSLFSDAHAVVFKIADQQGHTHRLRSEARILNLRNAFAMKTNLGTAEAQILRFKFFDEEGDAILISTDEDLIEAVNLAGKSSPQTENLVVKLVAECGKESPFSSDQMKMMAGVGAGILAVGVGLMMILNSKPTPSRY
jgi:CBS domain-containing protein